jgi:hypothetical protein
MAVRDRVRRWLGVDDIRAAMTSSAKARKQREDDDAVRQQRLLTGLNRQLSELRGLVTQQSDFTVEALRRAGWQDEDDAAAQEALAQALKAIQGDGDVIAGPWTGEVGFELLYWIPFLTWLSGQGLEGHRLVIVSRGGAAPWYRHLTSRYVDILDLITPEEFRTRTEGKKKQLSPKRELDKALLKDVRQRLDLRDASVIHPSAMFRLFTALWRKRATVDLVDSFASFAPLTRPAPAADRIPGLPNEYLVAKFYFSEAFPDTQENRRFVSDLLRDVSRQAPVALLSTAVRLDEHQDFQATSGSGLFVVDAHATPQENLRRQTEVICGARGFIGTYGGFSYLAPFYGVRSVSFFSRRNAFEEHHLDLANRVFDRLLPGGFVALDRRAIDVVQPAVARWLAPAPAGALT